MRTQNTGSDFQGARASWWRQPLAWLNVAVLVLLVNGSGNADSGQSAQIADLQLKMDVVFARLTRLQYAHTPFSVKGDDGKVIMEVVDKPYPMISLFNKAGVPVMELKADGGGSVLTLHNDLRKASVALGATAWNQPGIKIRTDGKLRADMGSSPDGHGFVAVYGQDGGSYAAALESQPDWKGLVGAYSKEKKAVAYITESPKHPGGGNVIMADPEGNKVFTAGFIGDGDGAACVMRKGSAKCLGLDIGGILGVP